jgi:hypothetical protein
MIGSFALVARGSEPAVLENKHLRIEVDSGDGTILRISDKRGGIQLAPAGGLADNFRLVLRGTDKKNKVILGRVQKLSSASKAGGGLDLAWNGPLVDTEGGKHNLRVRMEIRLPGESLEFRLSFQNDTPYRVAEAWYPLLGGLAGFGRGQDKGETSVMLPTSSPTIKRVAIPFGELALHYPAQMNMSYASVFNAEANRAMYFASHDTVARLKYFRFFEQSSPAGKDVFACIQHVPWTPPGKAFEGSPVVMRFHDGTFAAAGPIYREWFTKTFGLMDPSRSFLFPNFSELGDQGAEQFYQYPKDWTEPWMEFHSLKARRSIYLGSHDRADRSRVLHLELLPGHAATPRWDGNWPRPEELGRVAVGVLLSFVDFANHPPGKTYEAPPAVLQFHDGGWQEGQRIYRKWSPNR